MIVKTVVSQKVFLIGLLLCSLTGCEQSSRTANDVIVSADHKPVESAASKVGLSKPNGSLVEAPFAESPRDTKKSPNRRTTFPHFEDVAEQLGVSFTYANGATGMVRFGR